MSRIAEMTISSLENNGGTDDVNVGALVAELEATYGPDTDLEDVFTFDYWAVVVRHRV